MRRTGRSVRGRGEAVGPPPQPHRPKSAARGATIAFALVGLDAAVAERHRHPQCAGPQHALRTPPRPSADVNGAERNPPHCRRPPRPAANSQLALAPVSLNVLLRAGQPRKSALTIRCWAVDRRAEGRWGPDQCRTRARFSSSTTIPRLRDALTEQLSLHEEFEAVAVENGSKGVQAAKAGQIDLVIMDVGLPDIDGREAVRILRKNGFKAPIIMLTGHDTDSDTILGLESGANDYVTKPFRFAVLLARIRAQLRQHEASEDAIFTIGPYTFRPSSKLLLNPKGNKVRLTEKETVDPALSLPRRPAAGVAGDAAAGGLGLQFGSDDAHAGDAHLPATAEDRKRRRRPRHPGHRGGGYKLVP